jgi:hypothetical protein
VWISNCSDFAWRLGCCGNLLTPHLGEETREPEPGFETHKAQEMKMETVMGIPGDPPLGYISKNWDLKKKEGYKKKLI